MEGIGFVVFDGQREGFVEPFFLYGKVADGQFGIRVAAEIVHQAADNGRDLALTSWSVRSSTVLMPAPGVIEPARLLLQTAWFGC